MEEWKVKILKAQEGDHSAMEELLQEHTGLVRMAAKRFYGAADREDLQQIGMIGLMKAIRRFDCSYDVKFSTYAVPMIVGEIHRFLRGDGWIKVSRTLKEQAMLLRRERQRFQKEQGREPTLQEMLQATGLTEEAYHLAEMASAMPRSLEEEGSSTQSDGLSLEEKLTDQTQNERDWDRFCLKSAIATLEEREQKIIYCRYFLDETQASVAKQFGVSQVQISRLEKKILLQLRHALSE